MIDIDFVNIVDINIYHLFIVLCVCAVMSSLPNIHVLWRHGATQLPSSNQTFPYHHMEHIQFSLDITQCENVEFSYICTDLTAITFYFRR